jgi:cell wall-active antibiotic response 4TMS protein YvqF
MLTMTPPRTVEVTPHTAIGVSLALLGVVLTLDNLGFVDAGTVIRFWPLIPMLVGVAYIVQGREVREWTIGTAWLAAGTVFLLGNLGVFKFRLVDFLPLLLVALGVKVMFRQRRKSRRHWPGMPGGAGVPPVPDPPPPSGGGADAFRPGFPWPPGASPADPAVAPGAGAAAAGAPASATGFAGRAGGQVVRLFALLWGADRRVRGPVSHVEVSAVMGGCDLDLREAVPTIDPIAVQVFAMWGGIDIRIPPGWVVEIEAWPILGGVVDNTQPPALPAHRVILRGMAFMGGVEIKN